MSTMTKLEAWDALEQFMGEDTAMTTERAMEIAGNLDGVDDNDLRGFVEYIGDGDRPSAQAATLFPGRGGHERIHVTIALRQYANNRRKMLAYRLRGDEPQAMTYECLCDGIYDTIPFWAIW